MTAIRRIEHDWYGGEIPINAVIGRDVYLDSSYAFAAFHSQQPSALTLGDACGAYDRAAFVAGPNGVISVGAYTVLNGTYVVSNERVTIGAHCLLSWGVVITDTWITHGDVDARRRELHSARVDGHRIPASPSGPRPVSVGDNVWIGFDTVVMPGVTIGRGSIVGCKSVVTSDLPPYAVAVGNPNRILRYLEPDDTTASREAAFHECLRS